MNKTQTTPKSTRGGARPGSGRKQGPEQKATVSFRFTAKTRDNLAYLRANAVNVTYLLEQYIQKQADELRASLGE